jgi:hypothetical protein
MRNSDFQRNLKPLDLDASNFDELFMFARSLNLPSFIELRPLGGLRYIRKMYTYRDRQRLPFPYCARAQVKGRTVPPTFMHYATYDAVPCEEVPFQGLNTS